MTTTLNVYKVTFEFVARDGFVKDVDPAVVLVAAPSFGEACSLAEHVAVDVTTRNRLVNGVARVRDITLLHEGVELRKEAP